MFVVADTQQNALPQRPVCEMERALVQLVRQLLYCKLPCRMGQRLQVNHWHLNGRGGGDALHGLIDHGGKRRA